MRILIADDSSLIISRIQEALSVFEDLEIVGIASDGLVALEKAKSLKPDLAILDLKMPGLNGIQVIREIRKEDQKMVIMILTYFLTDDYRNKAVESGANYVYSKVDDFEKVPDTVGQLLETFPSR